MELLGIAPVIVLQIYKHVQSCRRNDFIQDFPLSRWYTPAECTCSIFTKLAEFVNWMAVPSFAHHIVVGCVRSIDTSELMKVLVSVVLGQPSVSFPSFGFISTGVVSCIGLASLCFFVRGGAADSFLTSTTFRGFGLTVRVWLAIRQFGVGGSYVFEMASLAATFAARARIKVGGGVITQGLAPRFV
jgi:hypothetical protein